MPLEYALQLRGHKAFQPANPWTPVEVTHHIHIEQDDDDGNEHGPSRRLGVDQVPLQLVKNIRESGLGKSTFINTLFPADLLPLGQKSISHHQTVGIVPHEFLLEEDGVQLELTIIDTPGFGDQLDRTEGIRPVAEYIDKQYEMYHKAESAQTPRDDIQDTRVHVLLYFIPPTGHRLRELDISLLRKLATKTSVIPLIAKADTQQPDERLRFKERIAQDLLKYDIKTYPAAYMDQLQDGGRSLQSVTLPFAVVGATTVVDGSGGKKVRGRQYRWGVAEVENPAHSDFLLLRDLLIRTNMADLLETAHTEHYANYRSHRLRKEGRRQSILPSDEQYEHKVEENRSTLKQEMAGREELMRQQFFAKVKQKEMELRAREDELAQKERELKVDIEERSRELEQLKLDVANLAKRK